MRKTRRSAGAVTVHPRACGEYMRTETMTEIDGRVSNRFSLHSEEKPHLCPGGEHPAWRVIVCDAASATDTVECRRCGQQRQVSCNFDEEYD